MPIRDGFSAHSGFVRCARIATLIGMGSSSTPTAFVLSGGASLGAIQVGMLHALYEREIQPDLIAATSAGALNGAFIAARPQNVATASELAEIWIGLRRGTVFPLNPLTGLFGFAGRRDIERYGDDAELIVLPPPCPIHVQPMDFGHAESLIEGALDESRRFLDVYSRGQARRHGTDHQRESMTRGKELGLEGAYKA
jgi:Patatin-like phospholipase